MKQIALAALVLTGACVPYSATTRAKNNGDRLGFRASQKRFQTTERQVAGETDHYDSAGNYRGTSQQIKYVNRTTLGPREVEFYQGDARIGEADYYRIGGDAGAAKLAEQRQRKFFWTNTAGWAASVAGVAGLTAAGFGVGGEIGASAIYIGSSVLSALGGWLIAKTFRYRKDARLPLSDASRIGVAF